MTCIRPSAESRWCLSGAWPSVVVCLILNLAVFAGIASERPEYLSDYRLNTNSDARDYVKLGRNFLIDGHYSRNTTAPYTSDVLRTPIYPLFAGSLDLIGQAGAIYLAQVVLQALSCVLLYSLVRQYFGTRAGLVASLLLSSDLMLVFSNFEAMSEPLFVFLLIAALKVLVPSVIPTDPSIVDGRRWALGGLLLALATLTRPTGLYLLLIFSAIVLARGFAMGSARTAIRSIAILSLTYLVLVGSWIGRNYAIFGIPRLTNNDAVVMVYFAGAGAYQVEHGLSLEEAQQRIANEYGLSPPEHTNNHWDADRPVAQMDAELRAATRPILTKYPRSLVVSSMTAVGKASVSHNVSVLSNLLGWTWSQPGTSALVRMDAEAFDRLARNQPVLIVALVWQLGHTVAATGLFVAGAFIAFGRRALRPIASVLLVILAYFLLTVAVEGPEAYWRFRSPQLVIVFALAGVALGGRRGMLPNPLPHGTALQSKTLR